VLFVLKFFEIFVPSMMKTQRSERPVAVRGVLLLLLLLLMMMMMMTDDDDDDDDYMMRTSKNQGVKLPKLLPDE
jgi:hypothetical protein